MGCGSNQVSKQTFRNFINIVKSNESKGVNKYKAIQIMRLSKGYLSIPQCVDIAINYDEYVKKFGES